MRAFRSFLVFVLLLGLLLAAAWFAITPTAFRVLWLPRLAKSIGVKASARDVDWNLDRSVTLYGLAFSLRDGSTGLLERVHIDYDWRTVERGIFQFRSIDARDGVLNLAPPRSKSRPSAESEPPKKTGGIRLRRSAALGIPVETGPVTLSNVVVEAVAPHGFVRLPIQRARIDRYVPGEVSSIAIQSDASARFGSEFHLSHARLAGAFELELDADFHFRKGRGQLVVDQCRGTSGPFDLAPYKFSHDFALQPYRLEQFDLVVTQGTNICGQVSASGPVDFNINTADIVLDRARFAPELVNVLLAPGGLAMQRGQVDLNGQLLVTQESLRLQGAARLKHAQLLRLAGSHEFPQLDGSSAFAIEYFPQRQDLLIDRVTAQLQQSEQPFLSLALDQPFTIALSPTNASNASDAILSAAVAPTDLAAFHSLWTPWPDTQIRSGRLSGQAKLVASSQGSQFAWSCGAHATNLAGTLRGLPLDRGAIELVTAGSLSNFNQVSLDQFDLDLDNGSGARSRLSAQGRGQPERGEFNASLVGQLAWFAALGPEPLRVREGSLDGSARARWDSTNAGTVSFALHARDIRGNIAALRVRDGESVFRGEGGWTHESLRLHHFEWQLATRSGVRPGILRGTLEHHPHSDALLLDATLADWSGDNLEPFLASWFPHVPIVCDGLTGSVRLRRDRDEGAFAAALALNQVWLPPPGTEPAAGPAQPSPLTLDLSARRLPDKRWELTSGTFALQKRDAFANQLTLSGTAASLHTFELSLASPGIDLTPVAGILLGPPQRETPPASAAPAVVLEPAAAPTPPDPPKNTNAKKGAPAKKKKANAKAKKDAEPPPPPPPPPAPPKVAIPRLPAAPPPPLDRTLTLDLAKVRFPPHPDVGLRGTLRQKGDRRILDPFTCLLESGQAAGRIVWIASTNQSAVEAQLTLTNFPLVPIRRYASERDIQRCLMGRLSGTFVGSGSGTTWDAFHQSLTGRAQFQLRDAAIESLPTTQTLVKEVARLLHPDFAKAQFDSADGSFALDRGVLTSDELRLSGNLIHLDATGRIEPDGRFNLNLGFATRTDLLNQAEVSLGKLTLRGPILVSLGEPTGDGFTMLPGKLPVSGQLPDQIDALDLPGWLSGVSGSLMNDGSAMQNLLDQFLDSARPAKKP